MYAVVQIGSRIFRSECMTARTGPWAPAFGIPENAANPAAGASAIVLSRREMGIEFSCMRSYRRREASSEHDSRRVGAMAMALVTGRGRAPRSPQPAPASHAEGLL